MLSVWAAAAAIATGQCRLISCVVRHLDSCCGFPQKARTSPALCIAGSTAVAGLGWLAGQLGGHICRALLFPLPLRVDADHALSASRGSASEYSPLSDRPLNICREAIGPLNIRREAALPPARRRRSPPKECSGPRVEVYFWPTGGVKSGRPTEISGAPPPSLWHPPGFPPSFLHPLISPDCLFKQGSNHGSNFERWTSHPNEAAA